MASTCPLCMYIRKPFQLASADVLGLLTILFQHFSTRQSVPSLSFSILKLCYELLGTALCSSRNEGWVYMYNVLLSCLHIAHIYIRIITRMVVHVYRDWPGHSAPNTYITNIHFHFQYGSNKVCSSVLTKSQFTIWCWPQHSVALIGETSIVTLD